MTDKANLSSTQEKDNISCPNCENSLVCATDYTCWCHKLPHISLSQVDIECLCKSCLLTFQANVINQGQPISSDIMQQIKQLGSPAKPQEGIDYTMENGLLVMTRWYLLRRGHCCENGCRHCPYSND